MRRGYVSNTRDDKSERLTQKIRTRACPSNFMVIGLNIESLEIQKDTCAVLSPSPNNFAGFEGLEILRSNGRMDQ